MGASEMNLIGIEGTFEKRWRFSGEPDPVICLVHLTKQSVIVKPQKKTFWTNLLKRFCNEFSG